MLVELEPHISAALLSNGQSLATVDSATSVLAFADQGSNLAGKFFQASLLPYIGFLYFLGHEKNKTPKVAYFGHQFLLLFVLSTVATGIVSKSVFGSSLADVDWLHGWAEALLTCSNLYVAFGFRGAVAGQPEPEDSGPLSTWKLPALILAAIVVAVTAAGPSLLGLQAHDPFLGGVGNLPKEFLQDFSFLHAEPVNALSLPTWGIHFSSVLEWLFAMRMVSQYAETTGNPKWRYLTWGMLPLHASGVAACTYHFFYNPSDLSFLVALQAGLTLLGNSTICIAALLIALSNGWSIDLLNPFSAPTDNESTETAAAVDTTSPTRIQALQPAPFVVAELLLLTAALSFLTKYGELALSLPFEPNAFVGIAICVGVPAAVALQIVKETPAIATDAD